MIVFKNILKIFLILYLSIDCIFYFAFVERVDITHNKHTVTTFDKEILLGPGSTHELYIVPQWKLFLLWMDSYDYIYVGNCLPEDLKIIAFNDQELKIYISSGTVFVNHHGKKSDIKKHAITTLQRFLDFEKLTIYHGKAQIRDRFVLDSKEWENEKKQTKDN